MPNERTSKKLKGCSNKRTFNWMTFLKRLCSRCLLFPKKKNDQMLSIEVHVTISCKILSIVYMCHFWSLLKLRNRQRTSKKLKIWFQIIVNHKSLCCCCCCCCCRCYGRWPKWIIYQKRRRSRKNSLNTRAHL